MAKIIRFLSKSDTQTKSFAKKLKEEIPPFKLLAIYGALGAGKTTFIKGFLSSFQIDEKAVSSPTFSYVHSFETKDVCVHHFDLYRLTNKDQFLALGFEEYLFDKGMCLIEWPEIIESLLPSDITVFIRLEHIDLATRNIEVQYA